MLFEKTWGDDYGNIVEYVDELPNGDFFCVGVRALERWSQTPGPGQEYACRISSNGTMIWEKDWGNVNEPEEPHKIIKCRNGTYMIAGTGLSGNGGGIGDITACNIDENGNILFYKFYNFYYNDNGADIVETYDSCFVICGSSDLGPLYGVPVLIKIDHNGNEIWRHRQASFQLGVPYYLKQTPDSGFIVTGGDPSLELSYYAKYKSDGNMDWVQYPFGTSWDTISNLPLGVRTNQDGTFDIYYSTYYEIPNTVYTAYDLMKHYNAAGNCLSTKVYTNRLGFLLYNQSDSAFWAIDYSSWGLSKCGTNNLFSSVAGIHSPNPLKKTIFNYTATSDGGYIGVGMDDENLDGFSQFYVVKFGPDARYQAEDFSETVNAYPNPSTDGNVTLGFDMINDDNVLVTIYTSEGKLIYTNSVFCPANSHTELPIRFDEISANGGMYILEARTSDKVIRKTLVVMKQN